MMYFRVLHTGATLTAVSEKTDLNGEVRVFTGAGGEQGQQNVATELRFSGLSTSSERLRTYVVDGVGDECLGLGKEDDCVLIRLYSLVGITYAYKNFGCGPLVPTRSSCNARILQLSCNALYQ